MIGPIKVVLYGKPVPWTAPFVSKRGAFSKHAPLQRSYKQLIKNQYDGELLTGPLLLDLLFQFLPLKSFSKKRKTASYASELPYISKPDLTNLIKFIEDACTGVLWEDDRQIVEVHAVKQYGPIEKSVLIVSTFDSKEIEAI